MVAKGDILEELGDRFITDNFKFHVDDQEIFQHTTAATIKFGNSSKPVFTSSPFVRGLDYGNGNDSYWTYEHMVV